MAGDFGWERSNRVATERVIRELRSLDLITAHNEGLPFNGIPYFYRLTPAGRDALRSG